VLGCCGSNRAMGAPRSRRPNPATSARPLSKLQWPPARRLVASGNRRSGQAPAPSQGLVVLSDDRAPLTKRLGALTGIGHPAHPAFPDGLVPTYRDVLRPTFDRTGVIRSRVGSGPGPLGIRSRARRLGPGPWRTFGAPGLPRPVRSTQAAACAASLVESARLEAAVQLQKRARLPRSARRWGRASRQRCKPARSRAATPPSCTSV
jgi:hypothetical protein